jgi:hypothetical protein
VTLAEMGHAEEEIRQQIVGYLVERLHIDVVDLAPVIREAAVAIGSFPQPPDDPPERLERGRPIRQMLGLPEPAQELAAALRARDWLQRLADDLDRHAGN